MLVDNGSLVNIIFLAIFNVMEVDHVLMPMSSSLYGFTGDSIIPRGKNNFCRRDGNVPIDYSSFHGCFFFFCVVDN